MVRAPLLVPQGRRINSAELTVHLVHHGRTRTFPAARQEAPGSKGPRVEQGGEEERGNPPTRAPPDATHHQLDF